MKKGREKKQNNGKEKESCEDINGYFIRAYPSIYPNKDPMICMQNHFLAKKSSLENSIPCSLWNIWHSQDSVSSLQHLRLPYAIYKCIPMNSLIQLYQ